MSCVDGKSEYASVKLCWNIRTEDDLKIFISEYFDMEYSEIKAKEIKDLCNELEFSISLLLKILAKINLGFSIIREIYHVDKAYTEGFYIYHASKHIKCSRFCERLSLFEGDWCVGDFTDPDKYDALRASFVGNIVINPTPTGRIGRVLLNPEKFISGEEGTFVRTTNYEVDIYGVRFKFRAFPFRTQDCELTTCAEVTLLNLLEYYGHSYESYKDMQVDELLAIIRKHSNERVTPSKGLTYQMMSKVLTDSGFSPILYNTMNFGHLDNTNLEINDILYTYVYSGIPVGVGNHVTKFFNSNSSTSSHYSGHSVVCIGVNEDTSPRKLFTELRKDGKNINYINAASYCKSFVVMDDNKVPYESMKLCDSNSGETEHTILVPLYKRMFIDASNAYDIAKSVIIEENSLSISNFLPENNNMGTEENPFVLKLFLASSRSYKNFKMQQNFKGDRVIKDVLLELPLPKFVWICEIYDKNNYDPVNTEKSKACGEILIDSTANAYDPFNSILLINYFNNISYRFPDDDKKELGDFIGTENIEWEMFNGFDRNLMKIS